MSDLRSIQLYLAGLFGDAPDRSLIEIRWRRGEGMGRQFFAVTRRHAAASAIAQRAASTDVYVGVLPRRRRGGGRDDLVAAASVLWADCDTAEAIAALRTFTPAPSLVIASGTDGHRHAYWLLAAPVSIDDIEQRQPRDRSCTPRRPRLC